MTGFERSLAALKRNPSVWLANLEDDPARVGEATWSRFPHIEGDVADARACGEAYTGVDLVLRQTAPGSVPRSMADPLATHPANVDGFVNVLVGSVAAPSLST